MMPRELDVIGCSGICHGWKEHSSHLHNHGTCSKSFCGKQGMKLSHGNFWPSHENTFSKKAVNLMVE